MMVKRISNIGLSCAMILIGACSIPSQNESAVMATPDMGKAVSRPYKIGEPYKVSGKTYYPKEDFSYDRTGIASWYGADFHGRATANGEIYNRWDMTAAHKTLPLPSIVEVTNLRNGRRIHVRINDRGPFVDGRIIDLSEKAAVTLGFTDQGTTPVRVRILAAESRALIAQLPGQKGNRQPVVAESYAKPFSNQNALRQPLSVSQEPIGSGSISLFPAAEAAELKGEDLPQLANYRMQLSSRPSGAINVPVTPKPIPPLASNAPAKSPSPPSLQHTHDGQYVQIGAFSQSKNARSAATIATKFGHEVQVLPLHRSGGVLYRVRIGPFVSQKKLDDILVFYKEKGYEAIVVAGWR